MKCKLLTLAMITVLWTRTVPALGVGVCSLALARLTNIHPLINIVPTIDPRSTNSLNQDQVTNNPVIVTLSRTMDEMVRRGFLTGPERTYLVSSLGKIVCNPNEQATIVVANLILNQVTSYLIARLGVAPNAQNQNDSPISALAQQAWQTSFQQLLGLQLPVNFAQALSRVC